MMRAIFARHIVDFGDYSIPSIEAKIKEAAYAAHAAGSKEGYIELENADQISEKTIEHLKLHDYNVTMLQGNRMEIEWIPRD